MRLKVCLAAVLFTAPSYAGSEAPVTPDPIYSNHCGDVSALSASEPLVKTSIDAIRIAHALWEAEAPGITDEKAWQEKMTATLRPSDCVWEVTEKPTKEYPNTDFVIGIGAVDGRFLGMLRID